MDHARLYILSAGFEKVRDELTKGFGTFLASGGFTNRATSCRLPWRRRSLCVPWLEVVTSVLLILGLFGKWSAWSRR